MNAKTCTLAAPDHPERAWDVELLNAALDHQPAMNDLLTKIAQADERFIDPLLDMLHEAVEQLRTVLAGDAANHCGDDDDEQERAIAHVEAWVSCHVSNGTTSDLLSGAIMAYNIDVVAAAVHAVLAGKDYSLESPSMAVDTQPLHA